MKRTIVRLTAICVAIGQISGCAVSHEDVKRRTQEMEQTISDLPSAGDVAKAAQDPPFLRIKGNYFGSGAVPLTAGNAIPERFSNITLRYSRNEGTFLEAIKNIRDVTGIPFRFSPDIYSSGGASSPTVTVAPGAAPAVTIQSAGGGPLPTNFNAQRTAQAAVSPNAAAPAPAPAQVMVPLNFSGRLGDYLALITGTAGLNVEFVNNELYYYQFVTRTFAVDVLPQGIDVSDVTNGSGQTSLSSGGDATSNSGSSSSSSTSTASISSKYEPWNDYVDAVRGQLTVAGKLSANRATGSIVVTDIPANVDRIAAFIGAENSKIKTRVDIEIRNITLQLKDGTNIGGDFSVLYKALGGGWSAVGAPPSLASGSSDLGTSGSLTINRLDGRFKGSNISISALNAYGNIVNDRKLTIPARNRSPAISQNVEDFTFLAKTTAATGGGTSGGTGVPGLTPGTVSYGSFIQIIPNVSDSGTVILSFSNTESSLRGKDTYATGEGATYQQITATTIGRGKAATELVIPKGATDVSISSVADNWSSNTNVGVGGASATRNHARLVTITLVTPYVRVGI